MSLALDALLEIGNLIGAPVGCYDAEMQVEIYQERVQKVSQIVRRVVTLTVAPIPLPPSSVFIFAALLLFCSIFAHAQNVNKIPQDMVTYSGNTTNGNTTNARLLYCDELSTQGERIVSGREMARMYGASCVEGVVPPDNPQPQDSLQVESAQNAPRFFSFRKSWQDPPLRTNRQMFRSKLYLASQVGGAIAMIVACRNKRSGEDWHSEVPAALAVDAMSYLGGRFFTQSFAVAPGVYQMVHYSLAATR